MAGNSLSKPRKKMKKMGTGTIFSEKAGEVIDEGKFQEISAGYEDKVSSAGSEEERNALVAEFENIKRSREKKLAQEARSKNVRNTVLGMFGEILKK